MCKLSCSVAAVLKRRCFCGDDDGGGDEEEDGDGSHSISSGLRSIDSSDEDGDLTPKPPIFGNSWMDFRFDKKAQEEGDEDYNESEKDDEENGNEISRLGCKYGDAKAWGIVTSQNTQLDRSLKGDLLVEIPFNGDCSDKSDIYGFVKDYGVEKDTKRYCPCCGEEEEEDDDIICSIRCSGGQRNGSGEEVLVLSPWVKTRVGTPPRRHCNQLKMRMKLMKMSSVIVQERGLWEL